MHGDSWQGVLVAAVIQTAMLALREGLNRIGVQDDPTLPSKEITAEEAADLIEKAEEMIVQLRKHPGLVKLWEMRLPFE